MNLQDFIKGIVISTNKLFGSNLTDESSESEILSVLESAIPMAEVNTSITEKLQSLSDEIDTLKSAKPVENVGITKEEVTEIIGSSIKGLDINGQIVAALKPIKEEFSSELTSLKELAATSRKPSGTTDDPIIEAVEPQVKPIYTQRKIAGKTIEIRA